MCSQTWNRLTLSSPYSHQTYIHKTHLQTLTNNLFNCINPTKPLPFNTLISDLGFQAHATGVPIDSYALCSSSLTASSPPKPKLLNLVSCWILMLSNRIGHLIFIFPFVGSDLIDLYAKMLLVNDVA
ncbi:unnamed protein product [Camellia sinensis]